MKNQNKNMLLVFLFAGTFFFRFYKLGSVPDGISLKEAELGLSLARYFGDWALNPLVIRIPFAIVGTSSVFLFFLLLQRWTANFRFSYIVSLLFSISPWHIQESRIFSVGILVTFILVFLTLIFLNQLKPRVKLLTKILSATLAVFFIVSFLNNAPQVGGVVDEERRLASNVVPFNTTQIFSNKLVAVYRKTLSSFYEYLDFGVYFFNGHPRQRWGVEETQKLLISFVPLISLLVLKLRKGGKFTPKSQILFITFLALLVYEIINFNKLYFLGFTESQFSPRRPVYSELVNEVDKIRENEEKVLVNERMQNPKPFFQFYLKNEELKNFEFREFDIRKEPEISTLHVDVLPFEPSPSEPLYTQSGDFPDELNLLYKTKDEKLNLHVYIYRYEGNN